MVDAVGGAEVGGEFCQLHLASELVRRDDLTDVVEIGGHAEVVEFDRLGQGLHGLDDDRWPAWPPWW